MKLKWYYHLLNVILLLAGFLFTVKQNLFVPTVFLRSLAALAVYSLLAFFFFLIVRPGNPKALRNFVMWLWGGAAGIVIIIEHVIITFDISYKAGIIFAAAVLSPYLGWLLYKKTAGKQ